MVQGTFKDKRLQEDTCASVCSTGGFWLSHTPTCLCPMDQTPTPHHPVQSDHHTTCLQPSQVLHLILQNLDVCKSAYAPMTCHLGPPSWELCCSSWLCIFPIPPQPTCLCPMDQIRSTPPPVPQDHHIFPLLQCLLLPAVQNLDVHKNTYAFNTSHLVRFSAHSLSFPQTHLPLPHRPHP